MKKQISMMVAGLATAAILTSNVSFAASTTANALQTVIAAISITKVADLNFGEAPQGDAAKPVAPGDSGAAQFTVTGEAGRGYTVVLPTSVTMVTGGGGAANKEIVVNNFTSDPNGAGSIGAGGTQTLKVGGTRAALANDQTPGSYVGVFSVAVVY